VSGTEGHNDSGESRSEGSVEGGTAGQELGATCDTGSDSTRAGRLVSTAEAADRLGVSPRYVRVLVAKGRLSGVRGKGGRLLLREDAVSAYLAREDEQDAQDAEGRRARPAGPRRSAALVLQDANRELTLTLRELAERQDALHVELAAQRERAARAEAERDALRRELAEARKPWWRRWFP